MKYQIKCRICGCIIWICGVTDWDTNALDLDEDDPNWDECCEHIQIGTDNYDVIGEEPKFDEEDA